MSNWAAIEIDGEAISAWECRAIYLRDRIVYDDFWCPFCSIKLAGVLIYTEGDISKSPHFSAKWGPHINGCDGEALLIEVPERKRPEAHYIPREMHFPEAFADRPPPRKPRPAGGEKKFPPPPSIETTNRRKKAGSLGRPIPKTYLLQPIVEAYNLVWTECLERAKKGQWSDERRFEWANNCRTAMQLRLEDSTNYHDAFRTLGYVHNIYPRIYHCTGKISFQGGQHVIEGSFYSKKATATLACRVVIESASVTNDSPRAHHALVSMLNSFAVDEQEVRWYAYGKPTVLEGEFMLLLENLDYLYVKKTFPKKSS